MKKSAATQKQVIPKGLELERQLPGHGTRVCACLWSPACHRVAIVPAQGTAIRIVDCKNAADVATIAVASPPWPAAWSPDGSLLVALDHEALKFWNAETWDRAFHFDDFRINTQALAWAPSSEIIASVSDDPIIWLWSLRTRKVTKRIEGLRGHTSVVWSPDGRLIATGDALGQIEIWDVRSGRCQHNLQGHAGAINSLCWSPDGQNLASASDDRTVRIWNPRSGMQTRVLEAHTESVQSISFAFNGEVLASMSSAGTMFLWLNDTDERLACIFSPSLLVGPGLPRRVSFPLHPSLPFVATYGDTADSIAVWKWTDALFDVAKHATYYRNAKVVLLGDTGVGKSGLSLAMTHQPFAPTESTHARRVFTFYTDEVSHGRNRTETREALLWDLAGQPGYRLIHQLHLSEVAVALIVIDARSETDPLAGVYHWEKALRQAHRVQGDPARPITAILVAARVDRGGISASKERLELLIRDLHFTGYHETSAKKNWGIEALIRAIRESIAWDNLPRVSSTALFQQIKEFLIAERTNGRVLSTADDLFRKFTTLRQLQAKLNLTLGPSDLRAQFDTCIELVQSRDLIRRLSFGNLILLQPELLDGFASAIVNAAKAEPDGMGHIAEKLVLGGEVAVPIDVCVNDDTDQQRLLLIATIEEMLRHEIMLSEVADDGRYLIFPSQFTRERPDLPDPEGKAVIFTFDGPIISVYATLIVRLTHTDVYGKPEMWKSAAVFDAKAGGRCGLFMRELSEGQGELSLFFARDTDQRTRAEFEQYILLHLKRRALAETIKRRRLVVCAKCNTPMTEVQVTRRRQRRLPWLRCPVCDTKILLLEQEEGLEQSSVSQIQEMDRAADAKRESTAAAYVIEGKVATHDFDVFIAHNSLEKALAQKIATKLKQRGLNPWLDIEQVAPGRWFQDIIQASIPNVKSVAVLIGKAGLGRWQTLEVRAFIEESIERGIPVIPVLLPGIVAIPDRLAFLRQLMWVQFKERVDEKDPLDRLAWGITGSELPRRK